MREYDEDIRPYLPVLQRLIVLVAVIVAVPVALWTVTAFVRTYIAPPHAPNYQRVALLQSGDSTADTAQPGPPQDITPAPIPPAPSTDQASLPPMPTLPASTVQSASVEPPESPLPGPGATPGSAQPLAWTGGSAMPPPQPAPDSAAAAPPQDQAGAGDDDNALPAVAPIAGRVPLPRRRPTVVAMVMTANGAASAAVPMPRARPAAAAPEAAPEPADNTPSFMMQWAH